MFEHYGTAAERYVELSGIYDFIFPYDEDAADAVKFLEDLAPRGRVLELGVGTGRLAIPLAEHGCEVVGVDMSPEMVSILESKDPDGRIKVVMGDMADPPVTGSFDVIVLAYNTIAALLSQDLQAQCVQSAAKLLAPQGKLVIEAKVPVFPLAPKPVINMTPFGNVELRELSFEVIYHDHTRQHLEYRHVYLAANEVKILPSVHRYVHISELDLMGRLAGLRLAGRYGDWRQGTLTMDDVRHVSVYRRIDDDSREQQ